MEDYKYIRFWQKGRPKHGGTWRDITATLCKGGYTIEVKETVYNRRTRRFDTVYKSKHFQKVLGGFKKAEEVLDKQGFVKTTTDGLYDFEVDRWYCCGLSNF